MRVNFLTSGFRNGFTDEFTSELKKYLRSTKQFVFVASDFGVHERTKHYLDIFLALFSEQGIYFENSSIIDYEVTPAKAMALIQEADVVWLAGGPTLTQIAHIKEYDLIATLRERIGITIGMSAGSINMARRVVLAKDLNDNVPALSVYDGIGLVEFNMEPHLNEANEEHIIEIEEAAAVSPIYGIYDESFILDIDGEMNIFGSYQLFEEKTK